MLYVYTQPLDNMLEKINYWFDNNKKAEWFNDPFVKEIILGIDKSVAVKDEYIESPVYGGMSPDRLSGGCKAVIAMYVQSERPVWATLCGDNCAKYIIEVSKRKDINIVLSHYMRFPCDFDAIFPESGLQVSKYPDFKKEFRRLHKIWTGQ